MLLEAQRVATTVPLCACTRDDDLVVIRFLLFCAHHRKCRSSSLTIRSGSGRRSGSGASDSSSSTAATTRYSPTPPPFPSCSCSVWVTLRLTVWTDQSLCDCCDRTSSRTRHAARRNDYKSSNRSCCWVDSVARRRPQAKQCPPSPGLYRICCSTSLQAVFYRN